MVNSEALNPAVRRVQLGIILRLLRERAELKPKDVAPKLGWYVAKVTKLEKGDVTISLAEVDRLIELYGVEGGEAEKVRRLGTEARKRDRPSRVPDWGQTYVALETAAAEVKVYDSELIPGTLQTEDYARAVLSLSVANTADEIEARVTERVLRGKRLHADNPPSLWVVLGEAALYREVGGRHVLRAQLQHLVEIGQLRHVTIQVLPFKTGEHIALGTSFTLIHLADPVATFAYLEGLTDADYLDRPSHTAVYAEVFDKLRVTALGDRESATLLERRIEDLT
ncbi:helix-turn-helix domain-containing protein [Saccharopolyspora sp. NPDC003752]